MLATLTGIRPNPGQVPGEADGRACMVALSGQAGGFPSSSSSYFRV